MRANAYLSTRFSTHVCAKMVCAFCMCVGRLSLTCTVIAELCSEIGLNIVKTSVLSSRVCQSCGRKHSTQLNFSGSLALAQKEITRNVEVPLCPPNRNMQIEIKRRLPLATVSSPDRSPQVKKSSHKVRSSLKKSLNFSDSTPSNAEIKEIVCHKQSKESLGKYTRDHLTFD